MKTNAPFLFARDLFMDVLRDPKNLYRYADCHRYTRSLAISEGLLPTADIFRFVPGALSIPVTLQSVFDVPAFPQELPGEKENYLSCTTLADSYALMLLTKVFVKDKILEIGTADGSTALLFALNTPADCRITTLDIQLGNPTVGMRFRNHALAYKVNQILKPIQEASLSPESFDLIFIDGEHSYSGVRRDTQIALELVRPGGVICWHDYTFRFRDDVVKALDEVRAEGVDIYKIAYCNLAAAVIH